MYQCISIYITCIQIKYIWNRCSIIPNYTPIYFVYTFCTLVLYAQGLRPCHGRFKIDSIITSEVSRMEVFQNMLFYVFDMIQIWFVVLICFWPGFAVMILIRFPMWFWYGFSHDSWCGSKLWFLWCFCMLFPCKLRHCSSVHVASCAPDDLVCFKWLNASSSTVSFFEANPPQPYQN